MNYDFFDSNIQILHSNHQWRILDLKVNIFKKKKKTKKKTYLIGQQKDQKTLTPIPNTFVKALCLQYLMV